MPIALKPFDASRDFVAQTNFRADGTIWLRKKPFDKSRVNDRVLRQLYEARKIAYAEDSPAEPDATDVIDDTPPGDETPVEQHETEVAAEHEIEGEAAPEQEASPNPTDADAEGAGPSPDVDEDAAAPEGGAGTAAAAVPDALDHDRDGKKGGSVPDNTGDRETLIKRLVKRHNHAELLRRASGLAGVTKDQTKAEIAAALVDARRVGDEPA